MQLPDGTLVEVSSLALEGDTINANLVVAWPGGHKAEAWVTLTPSMLVQSGMVFAPGIADSRKPEPAAIDNKG